MIQVDSLSPAKNETNVPVNCDLEIKVTADFEMDPRNVSFKLNDVDIIPNVFSVYQGDSVYELNITLYTRQRIKYGTERRYGQENNRYGMRDVHPSMLEYNSRYVCEFTVWGDEEKLVDSFVFTTEEGVFENPDPSVYFYSSATQALANYYPEWSKIRTDKYGIGQQLLNPIGEDLERIQQLTLKERVNSFIQTSNLNELNSLYRVELDKDFKITSILNEDGSYFYVQPEISAIQGITRFDLFTTANNDLQSFYKNKLPTRIDATRETIQDNILYGPSVASEFEVALDLNLNREGGVCLSCDGLSSSIIKTDSGKIAAIYCRIKGISIFNKEQKEDLMLLNYQNVFSRKLWKKVTSIQFFNLPKDEVTYTLTHFKKTRTPIVDLFEETMPDDNLEALIWSTEERNGHTILQKNITLGSNNLDVLRNSGAYAPIQEFALLDVDNESPVLLKDIAVDRFSNLIYGIDDHYLYIFDKREAYPKVLKNLNGDNGTADFVIELDSDELSFEDNGRKEVLFKCVHRKPGKTVVRYRLKLIKPDGSVVYIKESGEVIAEKEKAIIFVTQQDITLADKQYAISLSDLGDYILELETLYKGGGATKDQKIIRLLKSPAKIKYKLERILNEEIPVSILFDHDQKLKILTDENILHNIILRKDGVLIDYDNKILYFSEDYTSVDVE